MSWDACPVGPTAVGQTTIPPPCAVVVLRCSACDCVVARGRFSVAAAYVVGPLCVQSAHETFGRRE